MSISSPCSTLRRVRISHLVFHARLDRRSCGRRRDDDRCPAHAPAQSTQSAEISLQENEHGDHSKRRSPSSSSARGGRAPRSRAHHRVRPRSAWGPASCSSGTSRQSARGRPTALGRAADRRRWTAVTPHQIGDIVSTVQRPTMGCVMWSATVERVVPRAAAGCDSNTPACTISRNDGRCSAVIGGPRARQASRQ
jgi:hypothetical protein